MSAYNKKEKEDKIWIIQNLKIGKTHTQWKCGI